MKKKELAIIGGGTAALFFAARINSDKYNITLYEKNQAVGRKFLVAGDGGLNLTHSEDPSGFIQKYRPSGFLKPAFAQHNNRDFVDWLNQIGVPCFIGSSGRVFPEPELKPIQVLNLLLDEIKKNKVNLQYKYTWLGFGKDHSLRFEHHGKEIQFRSDITVFALGGGSWPVTGSAGDWLDIFRDEGIEVQGLEASNCAFGVHWSEELLKKIEGKTLKNCSFSCDTILHAGEITLTRFGIEGSGIYPLSPAIRKQLSEYGKAIVNIDFKPSWSIQEIENKLARSSQHKNYTEFVKQQLNLNSTQLSLIKQYISKDDFFNAAKLASLLKQFPLTIHTCGPLEDAISSVGGIDLNEIDAHFQLKKLQHNYVIGEMLDYDAPTGGYLIQSCYSMAASLADHLNSID